MNEFIPRLSFLASDRTWAPAPAADYSAECELGRSYAAELIEMMTAQSFPPLLGHVVQSIAASGAWGGVEVGFFQGIATAAIRE